MNAASISIAIAFISALAIGLFTMTFDRAAYSATTEPTSSTSSSGILSSPVGPSASGLMVAVYSAIISAVSWLLRRLLLPEFSVRLTLAYEHGRNYVSLR